MSSDYDPILGNSTLSSSSSSLLLGESTKRLEAATSSDSGSAQATLVEEDPAPTTALPGSWEITYKSALAGAAAGIAYGTAFYATLRLIAWATSRGEGGE